MKNYNYYIKILLLCTLNGTLITLPTPVSAQSAGMPTNKEAADIVNGNFLQQDTRASLTGAVVTISGDELRKSPVPGLASALAGRFPGLIVSQSSSTLGWESASLMIRGENSMHGNAPLIFLDGVPTPFLDLKNVNLETVESVTVMRDGASLVTFGYQSANGAIYINTKRGFSGKTKVSVTADFALQQATVKPRLLNSWEYASLRREAQLNDRLTPSFTPEQIENYRLGENSDLYPNNNWYDMFIQDVAPMQRYNLALSGGNERIRFYVDAGYIGQESLVKTKENDLFNPSAYLNRFNILTNLDVNLFNNLRFFLNQNVTIDRKNNMPVGEGNIFSSALFMPATVNGPLGPNGEIIATTRETDPIYGKLNRSGFDRSTNTAMNVALGLDFNMDFITKGLSLKGIVGYEGYIKNTINGRTGYARFVRDETVEDELVLIPYGSWKDSPLSLGKSSSMYYSMNIQAALNYRRIFNEKHDVRAGVGYYTQNLLKETFSNLETLPYDRIVLSGHVKYGYDMRYFLEANMGYGGSDQFKKGNRFGFFPSVAGAWIVTNEGFMEGSKAVLSLLKLRASYAWAGNDDLGTPRFIYNDNIGVGSGFLGSLAQGEGITESLRGNPFLQWEDSRQQNYGIDLGFLNTFTFTADYYNNYTTGIVLQDYTVPDLQGMNGGKQPYQNAGKMRNQGFELSLNYNKTLNKNMSVCANGYVAYNTNKVIFAGELDRSGNDYFYPYRKTGYRLGQNFGYLIDKSNGNGYFNSLEEIQNSGISYEGKQPRVGDFIYQDLNGDKIINEKDMAPIGGSGLPKLTYALSAQFRYKGFDAYLLFQGVGKTTSYMNGLGVSETHGQGVYTELHKKAWTQERYENGLPISYPALSTDGSTSLRGNEFFMVDRSYVRLKTAEVGYTLPVSVCRKIKIDKIRVYLNGNNLLTFDSMKFDHIDPEVGYMGGYPLYRVFNIGLNIVF